MRKDLLLLAPVLVALALLLFSAVHAVIDYVSSHPPLK